MSNNDVPSHESGSHHRALLPRHWHWRLLATCAAGTVVFGTIGSLELQRGESGVASFSNALYQAFHLFALHTPHFDRPVPCALNLGRWLGAVSTLLAVLEFSRHALGADLTLLRLSRLQGHVIVCGLGRKGLATVRCLANAGRSVVVVEKAPTLDMAEACRALGAHVLTGDATNPGILQTARINHAQSLIALCPDDSTNCDIPNYTEGSAPRNIDEMLHLMWIPDEGTTLKQVLQKAKSIDAAVHEFFYPLRKWMV